MISFDRCDSYSEDIQSFVKANGSFLQDWHWGDFQKTLGKEILRFKAGSDDPAFFAQAIVNAARGKKYLYFPYGPVIGKTANRPEVLREFLGHLKKNNYLFARIEPQFEISKLKNLSKSIDLNPHQTLILDLNQNLEKLLEQMHHKTRYNIRLAEKKNLQIMVGETLDGAGELFLQTAKRAGIKSFPVDYYQKLLSYFAKGKNIQARLYSAWHEGDLLAANLMLYYAGTAIYLFGGSSEKKRNLMAPYLLHWQAIQDAKEQGFQKYDFWGVETDPNHPWHGFSRFKLGFGGQIAEYAGTWDYVYAPAWYNVYKIARKLNRKLR